MAKKEVRECHEAQPLSADAPRPNFVGAMQAFIYKIHLILASLILNIVRSVLAVVVLLIYDSIKQNIFSISQIGVPYIYMYMYE